MNNRDLKRLKEKISNVVFIKKEMEKLESDKKVLGDKIALLEQDESVKRYLSYKQNVNDINNKISTIKYDNRDYNWSREQLLIYYGTNYNTNGIYVCVGTYKAVRKMTIEGDKLYCYEVPDMGEILSINSQSAAYKIYTNIENNEKIVKSISDSIDFENNNTVLYPKVGENADEYYKKAKLLFFETCLEENQEKAIQKVMKLNE